MTSNIQVQHSEESGHPVTVYSQGDASIRAVQTGYGTYMTFTDRDEVLTYDPLEEETARRGDTTMRVDAFRLRLGRSGSHWISCGLGNNVSAIEDVADSVMRRRVQDFARHHPELAARVRTEFQVPFAEYQNQPVNLDQLLSAPSNVRGCATSNGPVVEHAPRSVVPR